MEEKGIELLTCNRGQWRSLGASRVPCLTLHGRKKTSKTQTLLWLTDGGGVWMPLKALSLDLSPTVVKSVDLTELTFIN